MKSPEYRDKASRGPVAFLTVLPSGPPRIGTSLVQWFVYCLGVGVVAAYVAGRALPAEAPYLAVFRFAGCAALLAYAFALFQGSIWFHRSWSATLKSAFDGLVYALLTAGAFGWLWPRG